MVVQSIPPTVPEVGPPKIGTIADLALNPILLLIVNVDEAVEVDGGVLEDPRVLEDPQSLRDGCPVLDGRPVPWRL